MEGIKSIELRKDELYFIASKNNNERRVVFEIRVIAHVNASLHVRKDKDYATTNERYHGINCIEQAEDGGLSISLCISYV